MFNSRPLRIDYPNAWHHVMTRGRRGQDHFVDTADYQKFQDRLKYIENNILKSSNEDPLFYEVSSFSGSAEPRLKFLQFQVKNLG